MRTRTAVVDAAYALLEAEGPDALTADRLAAAAGISRRTLFNHFESVEAVLVSRAEDILERVRIEFTSRPEAEPLVDSAYAVIEGLFTPGLLAESVRTWRAIERSPAARRFALEANSAHVHALARQLGRARLDPGGADPLRASVLMAALVAAFEEGRLHWLDHHEGEIDDAALAAFLDCTRRALDTVAPAFPCD